MLNGGSKCNQQPPQRLILGCTPNIIKNLNSELEHAPIMFMDSMKQQGSHQYTKRQGCHSAGPQQAGEIRLKTNLQV